MKTACNGGSGGGVRWPRVRHSGRDGGMTRFNAATIRNNETTRGRCNERTTRGDVTTSRRGEKTGGRRNERTRGPRDDRRLKNQLAQQEDKRKA